jgi:hypothetical protein
MDEIGRSFYMRSGDPLHWLICGWKIPACELRLHLRTILIKDDWMVKTDGAVIKAVLLDTSKIPKIDPGLYVVEASGRYRWLHKGSSNLTLWPSWEDLFPAEENYHVYEWRYSSEDPELLASQINWRINKISRLYPIIHPGLIKTALTPRWYPKEFWVPKIDPLFSAKDQCTYPFLFLGEHPLRIAAVMPMRHNLTETENELRQLEISALGIHSIP